MEAPFSLLRGALWNLSLEPEEQRRELSGTVVTDELALDLDNAVASLEHAQRTADVALSEEVLDAVRRLNETLAAPQGDALWNEDALDRIRRGRRRVKSRERCFLLFRANECT